jgi:putative Holliday junction resolvase
MRFTAFLETPIIASGHLVIWPSRSSCWTVASLGYDAFMRVLAIDVGTRRVGLAISDTSRTLARPLSVLTVGGNADAVERVAREIHRLSSEEDGIAMIVVGVPVGLDGSSTTQTAHVAAFVEALKTRTALPIATEDERLTSREAESRLAVGERDWRVRKAKLDAASAAIFLQDYLDRERSS